MLDHTAKGGAGRLVEPEVKRHVEGVGPRPVPFRIVADQDVELLRRLLAEHGGEGGGMWIDLRAIHRLFVGEQKRAIVDRKPLRPEEHLRRAQHERILLLVERIAQDRMHELIDEERRRPPHALPDEREIGRLQRAGGDERSRKSTSSLQFSRASGSRMAAISDSSTGSSGAIISRACSAAPPRRLSSGGSTSGRA